MSNVEETTVQEAAPKKKKKGLVIILLIIGLLVIAGGGYFAMQYFSAEGYYERGVEAYQEGAYEEALEDLSISLEKDDTNVNAYYYSGLAYQALENEEMVVDSFLKARELDEDILSDEEMAEAHFAYAEALKADDALEMAVAQYSLAIDLEPDEFDYLHARGLTNLAMEEWEKAIADYEMIVEERSYFPESYLYAPAYYEFALTQIEDDPEAAMAAYEMAFELDTNDELDVDPAFGKLFLTFGQDAFEEGLGTKAIDYLTKAIEIDEDLSDAYITRSEVYFDMAQCAAGLDDLMVVIEDVDDEELLNDAVDCATSLDDDEMVIDVTTALLEVSPDDTDMYLLRAAAYLYSEDFDEAIDDFSDVLEIEPDNEEALLYRGSIYSLVGEDEACVDDLTTLIAKDPKNDFAFSIRSDCYLATSEIDLAIADAEKALELDPFDASYYFNLGYLYYIIDDYENGIEIISAGLELDSEDFNGYLVAAFILEAMGYYDEAIDFYEIALEYSEDASLNERINDWIDAIE